MTQFNIAHIHEQGVDMIIIPLDHNFARKTKHEQLEIKNSLQICAAAANLKGVVVPVWEDMNRLYFIAPPKWHPFFESLSLGIVNAMCNKVLTCH